MSIIEEESLSIVQQLSSILGIGSTSSIVDDLFAYFFFLVVCLLCFNLVFSFVHIFFKGDR